MSSLTHSLYKIANITTKAYTMFPMLYTIFFIIYLEINPSFCPCKSHEFIYIFYTVSKYKYIVFFHLNYSLYCCYKFIFSHISVLCMFHTLHKQVCMYELCFYSTFIITHVQGNLSIFINFNVLAVIPSDSYH